MRKSLMALPATAACLALAVPAGIASAQEDDDTPPGFPPVTAEIIQEQSCGQVTISYRNNTELPFFGDYRVGGEEGEPDEVTGDEIPEGPYKGEAFQNVFNSVELAPEQSTTVELNLTGEGTDGTVEVGAWVERGPEQESFTLPVTESINTDCGGSGDDDADQGDGGQDNGSGDEGGSGDGGQDDADESTSDVSDPDAVRPGGSYPVGGVETGGGPA